MDKFVLIHHSQLGQVLGRDLEETHHTRKGEITDPGAATKMLVEGMAIGRTRDDVEEASMVGELFSGSRVLVY